MLRLASMDEVCMVSSLLAGATFRSFESSDKMPLIKGPLPKICPENRYFRHIAINKSHIGSEKQQKQPTTFMGSIWTTY